MCVCERGFGRYHGGKQIFPKSRPPHPHDKPSHKTSLCTTNHQKAHGIDSPYAPWLSATHKSQGLPACGALCSSLPACVSSTPHSCPSLPYSTYHFLICIPIQYTHRHSTNDHSASLLHDFLHLPRACGRRPASLGGQQNCGRLWRHQPGLGRGEGVDGRGRAGLCQDYRGQPPHVCRDRGGT